MIEIACVDCGVLLVFTQVINLIPVGVKAIGDPRREMEGLGEICLLSTYIL